MDERHIIKKLIESMESDIKKLDSYLEPEEYNKDAMLIDAIEQVRTGIRRIKNHVSNIQMPIDVAETAYFKRQLEYVKKGFK